MVRNHLSKCASCAKISKDVAKIDGILADSADFRLPEDFTSRVLAEGRRRMRPLGVRRHFVSILPRLAAAALVLMAVGLFFRASVPESGVPEDVTPAVVTAEADVDELAEVVGLFEDIDLLEESDLLVRLDLLGILEGVLEGEGPIEEASELDSPESISQRSTA
jgi:hypothetical protein